MKNINNKGQAAIEFLVTYGWAIMAAMIVIGALTYFGMTNPATSLPDKCIFSNAFGCKDYQMNTTGVKLKVINTYGQTIYPPFDATCTDEPGCGACSVSTLNPGYLNPEEEMNISCDNVPGSDFNIKEKGKVKVSITYFKSPTNGYQQVSLGEVYATVQ